MTPYNGLANRRLQPLGHSSVGADMPDTGASRKRQIARRRIPGDLAAQDTGRYRAIETGSQSNPPKRQPWRRLHGLDDACCRRGPRSRARVICATSVQKHPFGGVWSASFVLRGQGPSVRVMPRRRGAPEVVPFLVVRLPHEVMCEREVAEQCSLPGGRGTCSAITDRGDARLSRGYARPTCPAIPPITKPKPRYGSKRNRF